MAEAKGKKNRTRQLTDRVVRSLKAETNGSQVDWWDADLESFSVRVGKSGTKSFCVWYRVGGGRLRRFTLGSYPDLTLATARDRAREALVQVQNGIDPAADKKRERVAETFGELADAWLEKHSKPNKRSWKEDDRIIDVYLTRFKNVRAKDLSRAEIRQLLDNIAAGRLQDQDGPAPVMANRVKAVISAVYNWGIEKDVVSVNPCSRFSAPGGKEFARTRELSEEEIQRLWKALDAEKSAVSDVYKLRLLTAQRGGEILTMRWIDLDLKAGWWTIPADRSKNGRLHRVWLSAPVMRIIESRKEATKKSDWLFPGRRKGQHLKETKRGHGLIVESAELNHWTARDLRRTAATGMASIGIPRFIVGKILNHAEPGVTGIYDRYNYDKEKQQALRKWATHLMTIISNIKLVGHEKA